jgi:hypothetical protein
MPISAIDTAPARDLDLGRTSLFENESCKSSGMDGELVRGFNGFVECTIVLIQRSIFGARLPQRASHRHGVQSLKAVSSLPLSLFFSRVHVVSANPLSVYHLNRAQELAKRVSEAPVTCL